MEYDFDDNTVEFTLNRIAPVDENAAYDGETCISWADLPVNKDASFYIPGHGNHTDSQNPHPTLGYMMAIFTALKGRSLQEFSSATGSSVLPEASA